MKVTANIINTKTVDGDQIDDVSLLIKYLKSSDDFKFTLGPYDSAQLQLWTPGGEYPSPVMIDDFFDDGMALYKSRKKMAPNPIWTIVAFVLKVKEGAAAGRVSYHMTPTFSQDALDGVDMRGPLFPRHSVIENLNQLVTINRFVLLSSPAASGKTSLLQMFMAQWAESRRMTVDYISCLDGRSLGDLLRPVGVDLNSTVAMALTGNMRLIVLDDAQKTYDEADLWQKLIKSAALYFPECKFIVSAVYSFVDGKSSPAQFAALSRISSTDLLLSKDQSNFYLSSEAFGISSRLRSPQLVSAIVAECGGLIGALKLCAQLINHKFVKSTAPAVSECLKYFLSTEIPSKMWRCYGTTRSQAMGQESKNFLERLICSTGPQVVNGNLSNGDLKLFWGLRKHGILTQDESSKQIQFTSIMARRYYFNDLFPNRAEKNPNNISDLIRKTLKHLDYQVLRSSTMPDYHIKEATFQHLFLAALAKCTTPGISILPEMSITFANSEQGGGSIDFYLNGDLQWGVELLVHGRSVGEHNSRFLPGGRYSDLEPKDYAVVDLRVNDDGLATNITRQAKRITVFFNKKFTACTMVIGFEPGEKLDLS